MTIEYTIRHSPEKLIDRAQTLAATEGVVIKGTSTSGSVKKGGWFPVEGTYSRRGRYFTLTITKIPLVISWGTARSELLSWLEKNDFP